SSSYSSTTAGHTTTTTTTEGNRTTENSGTSPGTSEISSAVPTPTSQPSVCIPPCPSSEAVYAHPRDCSYYFICHDYVPVLMHCEVGLEFNPVLEECQPSYVAGCTASP
ncbi:Chitin binding domain, partial [Trinorchestia longiramus]